MLRSFSPSSRTSLYFRLCISNVFCGYLWNDERSVPSLHQVLFRLNDVIVHVRSSWPREGIFILRAPRWYSRFVWSVRVCRIVRTCYGAEYWNANTTRTLSRTTLFGQNAAEPSRQSETRLPTENSVRRTVRETLVFFFRNAFLRGFYARAVFFFFPDRNLTPSCRAVLEPVSRWNANGWQDGKTMRHC